MKLNSFFHSTIALLITCVLSLSLTAQDTKQTQSERRIASGTAEAMKMLQASPKANQADLAGTLLESLKKQYPELKATQLPPLLTEVDALRNFDNRFRAVLDKRVPVLTNEELNQAAAARYPLLKRGDEITVFYVRGQEIARVQGKITAVQEYRIVVGSTRVNFTDITPIKGGTELLAKLRPEDNRKCRQEYIKELTAQNGEARQLFIKTQQAHIEQEFIAETNRANEQNGYTYCDGTWMTPTEFAAALLVRANDKLLEQKYADLNKKLQGQRDVINGQRKAAAFHQVVAPPCTNTAIPLVHRANAQTRKLDEAVRARQAKLDDARRAQEAQQLAAKKQKEADDLAKKQQEADRLKKAEEEKKQQELAQNQEQENAADAERQAEAERNKQIAADLAAAQALPKTEKSNSSFGMIALIVLISLGIIGGIVVIITRKKQKEDEDRFTAFFKGRGKVQKDFWDKVASDPENFKYAAYMFPTLEDAQKALSRLSYFRRGSSNDLRCIYPLEFGVYPHLNGAVCFIGGTRFSYALWREATSLLPELPNAQYFKVSTEPIVQLEIPNMRAIFGDDQDEMETIGVEDVETETGEFHRVYQYRTQTQEMAIQFLNSVEVNEVGIIIQVETQDGIFCKDLTGVFQLEDEPVQDDYYETTEEATPTEAEEQPADEN